MLRVRSGMDWNRPLTRSREHRMVAGVCGGLADWIGMDPTLVRVVYLVGAIVSVAFPGLIVYLILWVVMPLAPVGLDR